MEAPRPRHRRDHADPVPKYYQFKERLRERLDGLAPGTPVPSERSLSEKFGLSRTAVRQALQDLAFEGVVVRLQGRGTFVATPKVTQTLQLTSYTQDMQAQALHPSSRLLEVELAMPGPDVSDALGLGPMDQAVRIERLRLANNEPMAIETVHLDSARFPGIDRNLSHDDSLYGVLDSTYGIVPTDADETIETVLCSPRSARLLGIEMATPLLLLTRTSWDKDGVPIEFVRSLYRGDRYRFSTRISRPDL